MRSVETITDQGGRTMKNAVRAAWALALLVGLLAPALAFAQTAASVSALHDGVVVDAGRGLAYVMNSKGGIDALDLATGNVRWTSTAAVKPLALVDGVLLAQAATAQAGELPVVALDAKGSAKSQLRIPLPAGVLAQAIDGPTRRFQANVFVAEDGAVVVAWAATDEKPLQGMVPPEMDGTQAPAADAVPASAVAEPKTGAARLDLANGRVAEVVSDKAKVLQLTPRRAGAAAAKGLDLRRQLPSVDGRHVLSTEPVAAAGGVKRYRWTITDAAGAKVGSVESPVSRASFVVAGDRVLYVAPRAARVEGGRLIEEPLRLQTVDLKSGSNVWASAVIDTTFRGPFPP
jgi:hypothetical protein